MDRVVEHEMKILLKHFTITHNRVVNVIFRLKGIVFKGKLKLFNLSSDMVSVNLFVYEKYNVESCLIKYLWLHKVPSDNVDNKIN